MTATHWILPHDLLSHSIELMRPHGRRGNEGLALWLGSSDSQRVTITHAIDVYGSGFKTSPLHMSLSLRAMMSLTDLAEKHRVYLAGQVHSHPGTFTDLSELDEEQGIRTENYLSLVAPHYAQREIKTVSECGVHVFERNRYRRLSSPEVAAHISIGDHSIVKLRLEVHA